MFAAIAAVAGCHVIQNDHILGRDMAAAVPALRSLPPGMDLGLAPVPGHARTFQIAELRRMAAQNHIEAQSSEDTCFEWAMKVPSREALAAAMQKTIENRHAHIEIVDQSAWPAPDGEIAFPLSGLTLGATGPSLWRGYVRYGEANRFAIWARVRVSVKETRVLASERLQAGQPLTAAQLSLTSYEGPLTRDEPVNSIQQVIGLVPRFDVPEGKTLSPALLAKPKIVVRGDTLVISAIAKNARVQAECIAEEPGGIGEVIKVRNARSGRRFAARIESKTEAIFTSGDGLGLLAENPSR